jgi:hypothetical protein
MDVVDECQDDCDQRRHPAPAAGGALECGGILTPL